MNSEEAKKPGKLPSARERKSSFTNPKLAAIDDALTELHPCLLQFGRAHGFSLGRCHEGSFDVPRRWLSREPRGLPGIQHEIGLGISLPMAERLERGFFPEIPCTLSISANDTESRMHYHATIFEAQPFCSLRDSLPGHLLDAAARLDTCTRDFISQQGFLAPPVW